MTVGPELHPPQPPPPPRVVPPDGGEHGGEHGGERVAPADAMRAYAVHALTASGVAFAFLAAAEVCRASPDPRLVFLYLAIQVLIDAADGPFARRWQVKRYAARIDGRTIDDIVDYLTFTFIPLLLVWRMGWVPFAPGLAGAVWIVPALLASLLGFANVGAKDET